jgi:hypothetical protein
MGCCARILRLARSPARSLRLRQVPEILSSHATDPSPDAPERDSPSRLAMPAQVDSRSYSNLPRPA